MIRPTACTGCAISHHIERARIVHLAEGILMGLLGCRTDDALAALIDAARGSGLSSYAIANALVSAVAAGQPLNRDDPATVAVLHRWGHRLKAHGVTGLVAV